MVTVYPSTRVFDGITLHVCNDCNVHFSLLALMSSLLDLSLVFNVDLLYTLPNFAVETSQLMCEMYKTELRLKLVIKEELPFCEGEKNLISFYTTAWLHQPYFEKSINSSFSAMMKEVGHSIL